MVLAEMKSWDGLRAIGSHKYKAGIQTNQLKIALEPEAASIWCQTITDEAKLALSSTGNQYMVVDLGGGTADISVHELKYDGTLKEIYKASGGAWGGTEVDDNYVRMITNLVGNDVMRRFKEEQMSDYFDMLREFEMKKRTVTPGTSGKVTFRLFTSLKEIFEEGEKTFKQAVSEYSDESKIIMSGDKLRLDASIVKGWFEGPIQSIILHIKSILEKRELRKVNCIVLVGGFGENELVQHGLKANMQNKRIIIPSEAGLVVLKGAVKFGHLSTIISERVSKYTYGIKYNLPFNSMEHPESKKVMLDGQAYCSEIFHKFISTGESLPVDHEIIDTMSAAEKSRKTTGIRIYYTEDTMPKFTTDQGCKLLGTLMISHPEGTTAIELTFIFGETELIVKAKVNKTQSTVQTSLNFL